jgi:hypothetical protein
MRDPPWEAINETQLPLRYATFPAIDPELRNNMTTCQSSIG